MRREVVVKRYAKALARVLGLDMKAREAHKPAMDSLRELFQNPQAKSILCSPVAAESLKKKLLNYALSTSKASSQVKYFAYNMLGAGRLQGLISAFDHYETMVQEENGILAVRLTSTTPLSKSQTKGVKDWLERELDKKITLELLVSEGLLGGLVVEFGGKVIDLSVRKQLDLITKNLAF